MPLIFAIARVLLALLAAFLAGASIPPFILNYFKKRKASKRHPVKKDPFAGFDSESHEHGT